MINKNGDTKGAEAKAKYTVPTVDDILRGSAHALTVFKPGAADKLEIYLKHGKPYLKCFVTEKERPAKPEEMFQAAVRFIVEQNKLVEPLYQLEKDGKLTGEGEKGVEGRGFLEAQLLKSAQLLGDIWYSAWQQATPDMYLARELARRQAVPPEGKSPADETHKKP